MTDDEITVAAIEQALREIPEPTREQAHDAVCAELAHWAEIYEEWKDDDDSNAMDALISIRQLELAARLIREQLK